MSQLPLQQTSKLKLLVDDIFTVISSRKMMVMLLLGFSSGLPLLLSISTLIAWFSQSNISTEKIGLLTLISAPYTFKFIWSPIMDRFSLPFLGRRRGWILVMQILLMITVMLNALFTPETNPWALACLNLIIAFLSATQDININAYQADILKPNERALGGAVSTLGYRIAMFASGAGALLIAASFSWHSAYIIIGLLFLIGIIGTLVAPSTQRTTEHAPKTLFKAVILPFMDFFKRNHIISAFLILILIIVYKLGDQLAFSLNTVFFLRGLNFSLNEVAIAFKFSAMIFTILGTLSGGFIMKRIGIYKGFLYFSFCMALANLCYAVLAIVGKSFYLMTLSVAIEYFAGGLGSAAFLAFLFSLCNQNYSATQFALFSSLDSLGRVFIGPVAGFVATSYSWAMLFILSTCIGLAVSMFILFSKQLIINMIGTTK
ncbi:MFS transporter [Thiotrichales bacterium 19S3-7]|nr:MFS transporter [Thiotrichales bacterium 19S3-7]MCF6801700.1 MFS transporter [Thiotrichales bacterium 19S3-11]